MNTPEYYDSCRGCVIENGCEYFNSRYKSHIKCPCKICLVKVTCNKTCDEYSDFVGGANIYYSDTLKHKLKNKNCDGCHSKSRNNMCVNLYYLYGPDICPCTICLIKVICKVSCEPHNIFWRGIDATNKDR